MNIQELDAEYEAFKKLSGDNPFRIVISPRTSSDLAKEMWESDTEKTVTFLAPTGETTLGAKITKYKDSDVVVDSSSDFDGVTFQFVKAQ